MQVIFCIDSYDAIHTPGKGKRMDFERYILEILLREIRFDQVSLYTAHGSNDYKGAEKTVFLRAARHHLPDSTEDENEQLYEWAREQLDTATGLFDFVARVADEFLKIKSDEESGIYYRKKNWTEDSQFFHWKELVTGLGQEIFMMALLAKRYVTDCESADENAAKGTDEKEINVKKTNGKDRQKKLNGDQLCDLLCTSFPKINEEKLNVLLKPKLREERPAENHFHLKGSFPVFLLNWTCVMNHVGDGNDFFHRMKKEYRQEEWLDGEYRQSCDKEEWMTGQSNPFAPFESKRKGFFEMAVAAASYRLHLYEVYNAVPEAVRMPFDYETDLDETELGTLRSRIEYYRDHTERKWKVRSRQDGTCQGWADSLDYILAGRWETSEETLWDKLYDRDEVSVVGERYFLYRCFCEIFKEHSRFQKEDCNLFYKYLLISLRIRAELIQVNQNRGFGNFAAYQERKEEAIDYYPEYQSQVIRLTGCSLRKQQKLSSMEMRISPKDMAYETLNRIAEYQAEIESSVPEEAYGECFYVLHFPKEREFVKKEFLGLRARNDELRQKMARHIEEQKQLIRLEQDEYLYQERVPRVRGYDTCSGEIGCRPEVFGWFYRSIRAFTEVGRVSWIHWTYHVGEDFLDLVDGLRAIDEAVQFCELPPGSRIGHGMALGLDAAHYYKLRGYRILLPKQDLLDNIAWTLGFCQEYGIVIEEELQSKLEDAFIKLHKGIYGEIPAKDEAGMVKPDQDGAGNEGKYEASGKDKGGTAKERTEDISDSEISAKKEAAVTSVHSLANDGRETKVHNYGERKGRADSHEIYYNAWKLRGDRPELYLDYEEPVYGPVFEEALRKGLDKIRADQRCRDYYRRYHFSKNVREQGEKRESFHISRTCIELIGRIQVELRHLLTERQIGIECNPTSNYKIGPFDRFDEHPMLRMYGKNLEEGAASRMSISINTDDMGVFQTSLETEYASMYVALLKSRDAYGRQKYKEKAVLKWLDDVKRFGQKQAFQLKKRV